MAIRLVQAGDIATLRAIWDEYRTTEARAYAREQGWTFARVQKWMVEPFRWLAIDPATETVGVFIAHAQRGEVAFIGTRASGQLAQRRAADGMFLWAAQRAQQRGLTAVFGQFTFPPGVNWQAARAVRYFGDSLASTEVEALVLGDGSVRVTITAPDVPGLIAELGARA